MHTGRGGMRYISRWLPVFLLTLMGSLLLAAPAQAAAQSPYAGTDTVTLSIDNGTTFTYGANVVPSFTVKVTLATPATGNHFWNVSIQLEDGESFGGGVLPTDQTSTTLTFTHITPGTPPANTPLAAGHHTATATFQNSETGTTSTSNAVTFTINKAPTSLDCRAHNYPDGDAFYLEAAGKPLTVGMSPTAPGSLVPVDWQHGTYAVDFYGSTHVSYSGLAPDGNDQITVTAPSQIGIYKLVCTFSGTSSFSGSSTVGLPYTFSALHQLGSVQLFSNPTTLVAKQKMDFYIVFHPAASGLPAPTGEFTMYFGQYYYTQSLRLSPAGDAHVELNPLPSVSGVNGITIRYWGDVEYGVAAVNFPTTNPPIPGGSGSGGSGGSGSGSTGSTGQATASPSATGTAQATATGDATPTAAGSGGPVTSVPTVGGSNPGIFPIILFALLILAGLGAAAGGALYMARRAKASRGASRQEPGFTPVQSPTSSRDDTIPIAPGDR